MSGEIQKRTRTKGPGESEREEEDSGNTGDTHRAIMVIRVGKVFRSARFHGHEGGTTNSTNDERPTSANPIDCTIVSTDSKVRSNVPMKAMKTKVMIRPQAPEIPLIMSVVWPLAALEVATVGLGGRRTV